MTGAARLWLSHHPKVRRARGGEPAATPR